MVFVRGRGLEYTVIAVMMQVDMNLAFPVIWEQDKCGSSDPIGIGALDVKFSYLECSRMNMRRKWSFTRQFREPNGQIAPWTSISTISIIHGISYKASWGIGRLSEVDYGIWPQIRMVFCRIKDMVIFWKKIVSRCQSARRLSAPDFHPRAVLYFHYWVLHLLCAVRKNVLVEQTIQR